MEIARIFAGIGQRLLAAAYGAAPQDTYVLMLHEVTNGEQPQHPSLSITRENLERLLDLAAAKGVAFAPVWAIHEPADHRRAVLTFDDIFANAVENAFPLLRQRGIPYTVFITAGYVDKPGFVTSAQLEQLKQDPLCTIGFHANRHEMMRLLNDRQIAENTDPGIFEETYGVKCDYFAFPYGSVYACPPRAVKLAAKHGYRGVFSTVSAGISARSIRRNARFIPRLCVSDRSYQSLL